MSFSILSVRLSDQERVLLEAASAQARTSLSDFVRRKALEAAEAGVLDRRHRVDSAKDWNASRPGRQGRARNRCLKELAKRPPTWRK